MWSTTFRRCEVCPTSSFAVSGDISCTRCPRNHYSTDGLATCFPTLRIGGVLELDADFGSYRTEDFQRSLGSLLNLTSPSNVVVLLSRPGSTVFYFYITEGSARINSSSTDLNGNEQMLLFYDLYVTSSPTITNSGLPSILSFQIVSRDSENGGDSGVVLFQPSEPQPNVLVPPQPIIIDQKIVYQVVNQAPILSCSIFVLFISSLLLLLL